VVCGSFALKANADALRQRLINDGYPAVVVINEVGRTYRVVCSSFATKEEAAKARDAFKARYPDNSDFQNAWILYNK
jgi:cell division protein FtsN